MKGIELKTTIQQVLRKYPFTQRFFSSKSMYCNICSCKKHETIFQAAINYGHDPETFLKELKEFIKNNEKS
ncbi:MAG TPA: DUF1858 domain-containing protein [Persephonella sp.]|uniref:DUF1858 domain-containing protein n=1 Tax=Persephonella marina (strain DSM 14350 / EX-H1) TaxID=123214 RepID=C0QQE7_PERMH|nr:MULTISPECIES: DUF1858 domain-containing protein [Persephonella]ACO04931.1 conserved hypothetical protein [Persephonella marina EX-H1]HCB69501.1 DUF1858 domain-containing protein [Persephonella sp.]